MELALALGVMRAAIDVLAIMGDATLAVSAVVLGASMFQKRPTADAALQSSIQTGAGRLAVLAESRMCMMMSAAGMPCTSMSTATSRQAAMHSMPVTAHGNTRPLLCQHSSPAVGT